MPKPCTISITDLHDQPEAVDSQRRRRRSNVPSAKAVAVALAALITLAAGHTRAEGQQNGPVPRGSRVAPSVPATAPATNAATVVNLADIGKNIQFYDRTMKTDADARVVAMAKSSVGYLMLLVRSDDPRALENGVRAMATLEDRNRQQNVGVVITKSRAPGKTEYDFYLHGLPVPEGEKLTIDTSSHVKTQSDLLTNGIAYYMALHPGSPLQ